MDEVVIIGNSYKCYDGENTSDSESGLEIFDLSCGCGGLSQQASRHPGAESETDFTSSLCINCADNNPWCYAEWCCALINHE